MRLGCQRVGKATEHDLRFLAWIFPHSFARRNDWIRTLRGGASENLVNLQARGGAGQAKQREGRGKNSINRGSGNRKEKNEAKGLLHRSGTVHYFERATDLFCRDRGSSVVQNEGKPDTGLGDTLLNDGDSEFLIFFCG